MLYSKGEMDEMVLLKAHINHELILMNKIVFNLLSNMHFQRSLTFITESRRHVKTFFLLAKVYKKCVEPDMYNIWVLQDEQSLRIPICDDSKRSDHGQRILRHKENINHLGLLMYT